MTDRFIRVRWSKTRRAIDAMQPGQVKRFGLKQYFNCHSSVLRLNDAYEGEREYTLTRRARITVRRMK